MLGDPPEYHIHVRKHVELTYMGGFPHHYSGQSCDGINDPGDEELGGHLSKRGWCFQESLLPSRVLHFAIDHVSWSCATDAFCECRYGSIDNNQKRSRGLLADGFETGRIIDRAMMKEDWESVVTEYTRRQLTFSSDRLAALAGLAARVHTEHPEVEYLAGLWSDTLHKSLLWETVANSERIRPNIAPSWSWASVTGSVAWAHQDYFAIDQDRLDIIDFNCSPAGPNRYGALKDARLTVKGFLWRVRLLVADDCGFEHIQILGDDCTTSTYDMPDSGCQWDAFGEVGALGEEISLGKTAGSAKSDCPDDGSDSDQEHDSAEEVFSDDGSLFEAEESSSDSSSLLEAEGEFALLNVMGFVWFLVLRRCHEREGEDTFQRVGILHKSSVMSLQEQGLGGVRQITLL